MRNREIICHITLAALMLLLPTCLFAANTSNQQPTKQFTNGLNGSINLSSATQLIMDKSYLQFGTVQLEGLLDFVHSHKALGAYLAGIRALVPETVLGLAAQIRGQSGAPTVYSPEIVLSNSMTGSDIAYQRFEGSVYGDGVGVRYNPTFVAQPFTQQLVQVTDTIDKTELLAQKTVVINNTPKRLIDLNACELNGLLLHADSTTQRTVNTILQLVAKTESLISEPTGKLKLLYENAVLAPNVAMIAGYRHLNVAQVYDIGLSFSQLFPLGKEDPDYPRQGILALISAQEVLVRSSSVAFGHTSVLRYGFAVAWQDKVFFRNAPDQRWKIQAGLEYTFRTALDDSPTIGLFVKYRPYKYQAPGSSLPPPKLSDYAPVEYSLFGGIGPNGKGFIGVRVGTAISL